MWFWAAVNNRPVAVKSLLRAGLPVICPAQTQTGLPMENGTLLAHQSLNWTRISMGNSRPLDVKTPYLVGAKEMVQTTCTLAYHRLWCIGDQLSFAPDQNFYTYDHCIRISKFNTIIKFATEVTCNTHSVWGFRFSRRRDWRWLSSGLLHTVVSWKVKRCLLPP
jgi:hypothetical protein